MPPPNPDEVARFQLEVWKYKEGEVVSLMIHLGDRLGLYRAMAGAGAMTADELAATTDLQPRWLLEWLRGQAAAGLLESPDGVHFELTATAEPVLADEQGSLAFAAGAFVEPTHPDVVAGLADAFRTGIGLTYDQLGPSAAHQTERSLGPWARLALVPRIIPALEGVEAKLKAGAKVVDVGCGAGVALLAMAEAFPRSTFHGYDLSELALQRAALKVQERGVENVALHHARAEELPAGAGYDFALAFDCLHDMTRPDLAMSAVYDALASNGTWLIKDIRSSVEFNENRKNPLLALQYGFSVASCMSSALSEPGGAGLGTLGLPPELAEAMCKAAGFRSFSIHDFDDPANLYYEVRP
jgi:2-polyprenyl-3-methyl-5-hydroxy-6-metoxy-1,4-benzoquinol methylase